MRIADAAKVASIVARIPAWLPPYSQRLCGGHDLRGGSDLSAVETPMTKLKGQCPATLALKERRRERI